jgi:superfamily I DNA and/or RNA helicase
MEKFKNKYTKDTLLSSAEKQLFEKLRKLRIETSRSLDVKPFVVAYDTDFIAIVKEKPSTVDMLNKIEGLSHGKWRSDEFKKKIIEIINDNNKQCDNTLQEKASVNEKSKQENAVDKTTKQKSKILPYLKYFNKVVEFGFFKEWQSINPSDVCKITSNAEENALYLDDDKNYKELSDMNLDDVFKNFYRNHIFKSITRTIEYNSNYKYFKEYVRNSHSEILENNKIKYTNSLLVILSQIYSEISKKTNSNADKLIDVLEQFLIVDNIDFYPVLFKKDNSYNNKYVVPIVVNTIFDYTNYYIDKKVKIYYKDIPIVSPYNLYINDDIEQASNHLMLCEDAKWLEILNSTITGNKESVFENDKIKNTDRWNSIVKFLFSCIKEPKFKEDFLKKQDYSFFAKKEDQITILKDSYDSLIKLINSDLKDKDAVSEGLLEYYVKNFDNESSVKKLKEETNFIELRESLFNEKEPSFTGQLKFNGKDDNLFSLNIEQEIFIHCLKKQDDKILALNGPPGTGKTTVLQSLVATLIVDSIVNSGSMPIILGASFTNQAKNNIINGFKIEEIENDEIKNRLGVIAERWLPLFEGKILDYGIVTKSNDKSESQGFFSLESLEAATLDSKWLNEAEKIYLNNFAKLDKINFQEELKIFEVKDYDFNNKKEQNIKESIDKLSDSVKYIYKAYLKPIEEIKRTVINLPSIKTRHKELQTEIGAINNAIKSCEQKIKKYEDFRLQKDAFIKQWINYINKYPFLKKIFPFLQNELELKQIYFDKKNSYTFTSATNINDPVKFKLKNIQSVIDKLINTDPFSEMENPLKDELSTMQKKKTVKQKDLSDIEKKINVINEIIKKSGGHLDALLSENVGDETIISIYNYLSAIIDNFVKSRLFHLSMRTYEGKFIIKARDTLSKSYLNNNNKFKKSHDGLKAKFELFSMITPCFVSTMHSIYKTLTYHKGGDDNMEYPLSNFIDCLLVDEAGQCSPEIGALSFIFAKKAVVVGDTYQIEPIYSLNGNMDYNLFKYITGMSISENDFESLPFNCHSGSVMKIAQNNSNLWEFEELERGLYVLEHRRCPLEIIDFSNKLIYKDKLRCPENFNFKDIVKTTILPNQTPWKFIDVSGNCDISSNGSRTNKNEVIAIIKWIQDNFNYLTKDETLIEKTIAVITPFKAQANIISKELSQLFPNNKIIIGTVHALQGAEQKIVLFSMVYDQRSAGQDLFIDKKRNIINVAVSRAKQSFYVFGNKELFLKAKDNSPTRLLGKYLEIIK